MENSRPILHNKTAFDQVLRDYHISDHARDVLAHIPFVAFSGVAGGGRNTVINRLVDTGRYVFAVSDTTRPPKLRDGKMEQEGVNYYFRKEEEMLKDIQNGEFVEAEVIHNQQVSGMSVRELERVAATGKIPVNEFEFGGIKNVVKAKPDTIVIGLLPPSYERWMERLFGREEIDRQEFLNRLATAEKVLETMLHEPYFKLVVNESIDECVLQVQRIVEEGIYTESDDSRARQVAEELLSRVRTQLEEAGTR